MSDGVVTDTGPFALVPEWLLDLGISDRAVRLYALLGRFADSQGAAWPSRRRLASRMDCSIDSIDRAVKELKDCEALKVVARYDEAGDRDSNLYILARVREGGRTADPTGGRKAAAVNDNHVEREERGSQIEPESLSAKGQRSRKRDFVFEALAAHFGDPANSVERGRLNAATKLVKEALATDGVPVDDEERVSFEIHRRCSEAYLTYETYGPLAIPSNWTALGRAQRETRR